MTRERWESLMESYSTGNLTDDELRQGWHWCWEWDGLLVGPEMPEWGSHPEVCRCGNHKDQIMHSAEPWEFRRGVDESYILSGDRIILTIKEGIIYGSQSQDAERIVACVNACSKLSNDDLASLTPEDMFKAIRHYATHPEHWNG